LRKFGLSVGTHICTHPQGKTEEGFLIPGYHSLKRNLDYYSTKQNLMTPAIHACINFYFSIWEIHSREKQRKARRGLIPDHPFSRGI
jgi:hypothetical protein